MVRFSMLSVAILLTSSTLPAQSPAQAPTLLLNPFQTQSQNQTPQPLKPFFDGTNPLAQPFLFQQKPDKSERLFQYQPESPQANGNVPTVFVLPTPTAEACPVRMQAQQRGSGGLVTTGKSPAPGPYQRIHLILGETGATRVISATVTVEGTNGKWRILTASQFQTQPLPATPYTSTTLQLTFTQNGDQTESADLELPGFTSVKSIRLDSVTFADGTIWTPDFGLACRVAPDPFMLVSSR